MTGPDDTQQETSTKGKDEEEEKCPPPQKPATETETTTTKITNEEEKKTTLPADTSVPNSNTKTIREGSTVMHYPADQEESVFYNPVQVQNRDLSILMIRVFAEQRAVQQATAHERQRLKQQQQQSSSSEKNNNNNDNNNDAKNSNSSTFSNQPPSSSCWKQALEEYQQGLDPATAVQTQLERDSANGLCILDALAASGLRSIRYWKEIPGVHHVTINDLDPAASQRAHTNMHANQLDNDQLYNIDNNNNNNNTNDQSEDPASLSSGSSFHHRRRRRRPRGVYIRTGDATDELYASRPPPSAKPSRPGVSAVDFSDPSWDVVDLDPYGSAAPFLDAAIQGSTNGGLLCITCTDMAALGGSRPETCFGRYHAAMPLQRAPYLQELALRILLYALATQAAVYGRTIRPRLSVGMNFYVRVFVTVHDDKAGVNQLSLRIGHVYQSTKCESFRIVPAGQLGGKKNTVYQAGRLTSTAAADNKTRKNNKKKPNDQPKSGDDNNKKAMDNSKKESTDTKQAPEQPKRRHDDDLGVCEETQAPYKIGGPLWLGPLHDPTFVDRALQLLDLKDTSPSIWATRDRLKGILLSCREELDDCPLYYRLPDMSATLHISTPPLQQVRYALVNAGYRVSSYHKEPQAVKTNAPSRVVWDIFRAWCRKNHLPKKTTTDPADASATDEKALSEALLSALGKKAREDPVASRILTRPIQTPNISFDRPLNYKEPAASDVSRFPMNPQAHWGPKKATTGYKRAGRNNDNNNNNNKRKNPPENETATGTPEEPPSKAKKTETS